MMRVFILNDIQNLAISLGYTTVAMGAEVSNSKQKSTLLTLVNHSRGCLSDLTMK